MFSYDTQIRVRYAETDQMGFVYYGNYFTWFEVGRVESFRSIGLLYSELEKTGVIMPVVDVQCRYLRPAVYDQLLTIRTTVRELPMHHKIEFHQEVLNENAELLASGKVTLYFVEATTMKKAKMPDNMRDGLLPFFK